MTHSVRELFSKEEILALTSRSDLQGAWAVARTWAMIALSFYALALWPHPITVIAAVLLLGGMQLALAILAHEATHRTLFKTRHLNDWFVDWVCARPIWLDVVRYRNHHLKHHAHTGTDLDPDISLVEPFPTTPIVMTRKLVRDISGVTGIKRTIGLLLMDFGVLEYTVAAKTTRLPRNARKPVDYVREGIKNITPVLLTNGLLWAALSLCGIGWAYIVWVVANLTTFSFYMRIRSIAEHACMERDKDILRNTRTTRAGLLARLTVAPLNVNYHAEHHLMASVPFFRLPEMHRLLVTRSGVQPCRGYLQVMRQASSRV